MAAANVLNLKGRGDFMLSEACREYFSWTGHKGSFGDLGPGRTRLLNHCRADDMI